MDVKILLRNEKNAKNLKKIAQNSNTTEDQIYYSRLKNCNKSTIEYEVLITTILQYCLVN